MIGCVYSVNGTVKGMYYYQRNLLGDVVAIYDFAGTKITEYTYDAFGNCTFTYGYSNEFSRINPIRYRGYYLDRETNLYYLNSRYYNPEWRRFLSPDDTAYLDTESVNGLNLYCYCNNDPVNYCDPSGHAPQWLQVAGLIGFGVGLLLCGIAIGILTGGVGTATFIGAVAVGAAKGTLIGAAIGLGIGAISGGIGALAAGEEFGSSGFWSDVAFATMLGFGAGAVVGAIVGGFSGANGWYNAKALEFTNYGSNEVVLGRSPGYVEIAKSRGATYFHTTDDVWNATQSMRGVGTKGMWRINKAFLKQQIKAGAHFTLADPSGGFFYAKEVAYVTKYGVCVYL